MENTVMFLDGKAQYHTYKGYFFANYKFTGIPVKIQVGFFCGTWKADPKIHMKGQGERIAKTILKNNKVGRLFLPDIRLIRRYWYTIGQ